MADLCLILCPGVVDNIVVGDGGNHLSKSKHCMVRQSSGTTDEDGMVEWEESRQGASQTCSKEIAGGMNKQHDRERLQPNYCATMLQIWRWR